MDLEHILQERFGLPGFRPGQKNIIESVMEGRDTIAIMATGGGKSLCYQFPGAILPGLTLVITPIISLMADQVKRLHELQLSAGYLSSAKSAGEQAEDLRNLAAGKYKFILVSPERLLSKKFLNALGSQKIGFIAVDEAHCISQWGHDFRPDYLKIGEFRQKMGNPACLALTGTATDRVEREIGHFLGMKDFQTFKFTFNRPNLRYLVYDQPATIDKLDKLRELLSHLRGCGIIYCATRREVEFIAHTLSAWGIACAPYHAGLQPQERDQNQSAWISGRIPLISATNAFGMGIDKPDVRFVIHFSMSNSIENYYQEAGRAGRDGEASLCIVLNSREDDRKLRVVRKLNDVNPLWSAEHKQHLQTMTDSCEAYVHTTKCRRQTVLKYFSEHYPYRNCGSCDHCLKNLNITGFDQLLLPSPDRRREQERITHSISEFVLNNSPSVRLWKKRLHQTFPAEWAPHFQLFLLRFFRKNRNIRWRFLKKHFFFPDDSLKFPQLQFWGSHVRPLSLNPRTAETWEEKMKQRMESRDHSGKHPDDQKRPDECMNSEPPHYDAFLHMLKQLEDQGLNPEDIRTFLNIRS